MSAQNSITGCEIKGFGRLLVTAMTALLLCTAQIQAANVGIGFSGNVPRDLSSGLSPLTANTVSFTDEAGMRLIVANTGNVSSSMRLMVYDDKFRAIAAQIFPQSSHVTAGRSAEFVVIIPFDGNAKRELNICADRAVSGNFERQVCGQYTIRREFLD
ncbi:MAG: hypothetical protein AB3N20_16025 [Rhizobiaceae bacterium]